MKTWGKPLRVGLVAVLLAGCADREPVTPRDGLLGELTRTSGELNHDTIHVAAPAGPGDRFGGTRIDSIHYRMLRAPYEKGKVGGFYATYRVEAVPGYEGFLLRVPSRYTSSAIDLWMYDNNSGSWLSPVRIADGYGGGTWQYAMDGWLVDLEGDGHTDLVHRHRHWWTDESLNEHQADSLFVRRWLGNAFSEAVLSDDTTLARIFLPRRWR